MIYSSVVVALAVLGVVNGHVCMWSPEQRGGFSIDTPGESKCYLKEGPCGGMVSGEPKTTLSAGSKFNVLFQQNLNHFYIENPGKLVVDFATKADPTEEDFVQLGEPVSDYNAMNEITQTNFTIGVAVPNQAVDHGVIRLRYLSQNPTENDRGTTFYQCADVRIVQDDADTPSTIPVASPVAQPALEAAKDCCAPKQFVLHGYETGSWRNPTDKKYYFDAVNKLFRVDTNSGNGVTPKDGTFQMYSNFTSGIEYYYNVHANTCGLYGLNYWSDWCYGAQNAQTYQSSVKVGNQVADVWGQKGNPFVATSTRGTCTPVSSVRTDSGEGTFFYDMRVGEPPKGFFELPAACIRKAEEHARSGAKLTPSERQTLF